MKTRSYKCDNPKMAVKGYADGGPVPLPPVRPKEDERKPKEEPRRTRVTVDAEGGHISPDKNVNVLHGGARLGVSVPVGSGTVDAGISGIGNSVRVKTPYGTFKDNRGQFSGVDIGYTRGNANFGASYSTLPDEQGKQDKRIMFTFNKSF